MKREEIGFQLTIGLLELRQQVSDQRAKTENVDRRNFFRIKINFLLNEILANGGEGTNRNEDFVRFFRRETFFGANQFQRG